ncbi:MAG: RNA-binding protein [Hyphomicrobiaceae bacterium]|nr:RNA-binding protein [Hyphomicrobiaceae bacterium]
MAKREDILRQCAVTREERATADLVRFALGPDDLIAPDVDGRAPGRGVWVGLGQKLVAEAERRKVFAKSLKSPVKVPQDLALLTRSRLEQRLTGALGLARKAGQIATGAAKVAGALSGGHILALFTAIDAAPDGRRKMLAHLKAAPNAAGIRHFELLTAEQMSLATGRENVIHAALTEGAAARGALDRADRLARYLAN